MNRFSALCIIIWSFPFLYAQNSITGKIFDQDSLPLQGAIVSLPETNKGTISDKLGHYQLNNLPDGKIRVQFSFIGHSNKVETLILSGETIELNVVLSETSVETEEIVVTGGYSSTQHENAVKIEVLKINLIENKSTPNFTEMLTRIPGIDMISKGSGVSKPVIRGLSMNDILVLNNGVRFENYQYSSHHPLGIDEFGIETIEIIKGPASLLYGSDAIGGVINFIKEKPALQHSMLGDYSMQLFSNSMGMTQNLGIKGASENFFGGIRLGLKNNADYLQGGGDFVPNSRAQEYSIKTNAGFSGKSGTFKLFYDYNKQNLGLVEDEPVELISERGRKCEIFYQQLNTHLVSSQNKLFLGRSKLDVNAAFQNTELIHFSEADMYEIQMKLATLSYETKLYLPSNEGSEYIIGFQGTNQANTNLNNRETILLPNATTNNYSGFGLLQHTFWEKLKFQAGVRYDYKTIITETIGSISDSSAYRVALDKNFGSFSGSIGATYAINSKLFFRANMASAYRTPNLAELTSNGQHETIYEVGDNNLVPENSYEGDLSIHYHIDNVTFDLAGFYNFIQNYIFLSPTGTETADGLPIYQYMQNNSELYGGETGLHIHPSFIPWFHFQTTFATVTGKQEDGSYLPFIPAHKLNFEFRVEREKLAFMHDVFASANTNTAFEQNNPAPDETGTCGYTLLDLSLGGKIKVLEQYVSFALSVNNLFDVSYIDHLSTLKEVGFYNPGRNIAFSLKVPFGLRFND